MTEKTSKPQTSSPQPATDTTGFRGFRCTVITDARSGLVLASRMHSASEPFDFSELAAQAWRALRD